MKHILVVDDDVAVAKTVAAALADYHVTIARDGRHALALAANLPSCALLITDYFMPTMAGDELVGRLHDRQPAIRTLLLTGYGAYIDVAGCPVDAQLAKPLQIGVLRKTVETLIGAAR